MSENKYYDSHYNEMGIQPIEIMQRALEPKAFLDHLATCIIKYHMRAGHKEGESAEKDLVKRDRYIAWYNLVLHGGTINPREDCELPEDAKQAHLEVLEQSIAIITATARIWKKEAKQ